MSNLFMAAKNFIAKHYSKDIGRMLIHTGVAGWVLSSIAQVAAIVINDKIPKEQKMFLVPQEMADAAVNILSFYVVTQSCKSFASQLVKTGKWLPKSVRTFLENAKFPNIGKIGTDIGTQANLPANLVKNYEDFYKGIDFTATTLGSVLSCNIITPIIRNKIAANRQKDLIDKMNSKKDVSEVNSEPKPIQYLPKPTMIDFQARCSRPYLKI